MLYIVEFSSLMSLSITTAVMIVGVSVTTYNHYHSSYLYEILGTTAGFYDYIHDRMNETFSCSVYRILIFISYVLSLLSLCMFSIIVSHIDKFKNIKYSLGLYIMCTGMILSFLNFLILPFYVSTKSKKNVMFVIANSETNSQIN